MPRPRTVSDGDILAAAGRLVGRAGVEGFTLAAVAGEAGLSAATLVQRFGSKRGLLLALAEQAPAATSAVFDRVAAEHPDAAPLTVLHRALAALAGEVTGPEEVANHLSFLRLDLADAEFRTHAADQARALRQGLAALTAAAVARGELRPGSDPERLARAVQAAYNGALIVWAVTGEGRLAEHLHDRVEDAIGPYRTRPVTGDAPCN